MKRIAVWGFLIAGLLGIISGLRDIFAPGFFSMSPRNPDRTDIVLQLVSAATFLVLAVFTSRGGFERGLRK